jgi:hypothetical protein
LHTAGKGPKKCAGRVQPMLVALVAFMTALAASRSGAFGVVGEVVGIVFLAAADLLLRLLIRRIVRIGAEQGVHECFCARRSIGEQAVH